jgi:hypothetical protein
MGIFCLILLSQAFATSEENDSVMSKEQLGRHGWSILH